MSWKLVKMQIIKTSTLFSTANDDGGVGDAETGTVIFMKLKVVFF